MQLEKLAEYIEFILDEKNLTNKGLNIQASFSKVIILKGSGKSYENLSQLSYNIMKVINFMHLSINLESVIPFIGK